MQVQSLSWKYSLEEEIAPTQYSCLENPMDRGAWWATVHGVAESDGLLTEQPKHIYGQWGGWRKERVGCMESVTGKLTLLYVK